MTAPTQTGAICAREIGDPAVCTFFAEQIAIFAAVKKAEGKEPSAAEFCGMVVQLSSAASKTDLLEYIPGLKRWEVCVNSLLAAMDSKAEGVSDKEAIEANVEAMCKREVEGVFASEHLPTTVATPACTHFTAEANKALAAGQLDPDDGGQTFCTCAQESCKVEMPMRQSKVCDVPIGFPMSDADLPDAAKKTVKAAKDASGAGTAPAAAAPLLTMEQFAEMAKTAFGNGHIAFLTGDKNKD